jgi:hypothetical protein
VKNLLVFLLVLAAAGLFFHDRQQTADLNTAQQANDLLTQQLTDKTTALTTLQNKYQQLSAQLAAQAQQQQTSAGNRFSAPAAGSAHSLQGSGPLDQPAYSGGGHSGR